MIALPAGARNTTKATVTFITKKTTTSDSSLNTFNKL